MTAPTDEMLHAGIRVDFLFPKRGPKFGDLLLACERKHPRFPPTKSLHFEQLADLQFDQVDDYFGVRGFGGEGDDVPIWLFPLIGGEPVHHHEGPFEGMRLAYNVLRNPEYRVEHFLTCVNRFATIAGRIVYRGEEVAAAELEGRVRGDIAAVVQHWVGEGIVVGSNEALEIDF